MKGRPLRFLGIVMSGWIGARVILLWPADPTLPGLIRAIAPPLAAAEAPHPVQGPAPRIAIAPPPPAAVRRPDAPPIGHGADNPRVALALAAMTRFGREQPDVEDAQPLAPGAARLPPPLVPTPPPTAPARLAGSLWAIGRGGTGRGLPGGQLGASQAGARITYALDQDRRVALAGRASTPLRGRGAEAALGIEWRPIDAPVRLIAEHRIALDGGRGGPTLIAVAGLPPARIAGWTLEAYGQAGAIARGRVERFADGAARFTRVAAGTSGRPDLGVGAWGGAQRGVTRLDIGPTVGIGVPVGGRRMRLTADWRVRVAGDARPGSGPALSIGTDF